MLQPSKSKLQGFVSAANSLSGVAIGLDCFIGEHERTLGLGYCSYAYYGDDGEFGDGTYEPDEYGPKFNQGDIIGCGVDYHAQQLFFTKNGKCLGKYLSS